MNAEDRLRAALADRAGTARTSPDALDGVFGRVARHRRNVLAGTALSVVATTVAAGAVFAGARPDAGAVRPVAPVSASATPSPTESPAPSATTSPAASPSPAASFAPVTETFPDDTALVRLADHRLVAVSTTTGAERATVGTLPYEGGFDWSPDREYVVYESAECRLSRLDLATGVTTPVGRGQGPRIGDDGRIAAIGCGRGEVVVVDPATRRSTTYAARDEDAVDRYGNPDWWEHNAYVSSLAWRGRHLVVARGYEGAIDVRVIDTGTGAAFGSDPADHVATGRTTVEALHCCYPGEPDPGKTTFYSVPDILDRRRPTARQELFTHPGFASSLTVDARGAVLYLADGRLWRWSGGEPVLIRRAAVAVAG